MKGVITTDIGGVQIQYVDDRLYAVDMRIYGWLETWLAPEEARELIHSLEKRRLMRLIIQYHREIATIDVWSNHAWV